jgi:hypothetical protein
MGRGREVMNMTVNARIQKLLVLAGILAVLPTPARAGAPSALSPETYRSLAEELQGKRQAVVVTGDGRQKIKNPKVTDDGLLQGTAGPIVLIPWTAVDRIEVMRSNAGSGALIGAAFGGVGGLALGISATKECSPSSGYLDLSLEFCGASAGDVFALTLIGASVGALLGAAIGALSPSWKPVYEGGAGGPQVKVTEISGEGASLSLTMAF